MLKKINKLGISVLISEILFQSGFFGFMSIVIANLLRFGVGEKNASIVMFFAKAIIYGCGILSPLLLSKIKINMVVVGIMILSVLTQCMLLLFGNSLLIFVLGLIIFCIFYSIAKPLIPILGMEQIKEPQAKQKMISLLFIGRNAGAFCMELGMSSIYLKSQNTRNVSFWIIIVELIALLILLKDIRKFKVTAWKEGTVANLWKEVKKIFSSKENKSGNQNRKNEAKLITSLFCLNILLYFAYDQIYSVMLIHTSRTNLNIFNLQLLPSQLQIVNSFVIIFGTTFLLKIVRKLSPLSRYQLGLFFLALGFGFVTILELLIEKNININCSWDLVSYGLMTISEIFTYTAELELSFIYFEKSFGNINVVFVSFSALFSNLFGIVAMKLIPRIDYRYFGFLCFVVICAIGISLLVFNPKFVKKKQEAVNL